MTFRKLLLPLVLLLFCSSSTKLVRTKITDDVTVSIPQGFFPMTPEDITQRLPSVRAPLGAYTNEDRVVDFAVNISATQWPDGNREIAAKFFKASLFNLYDKVTIISEGIHEIRRKPFIYFEFESRINASKRSEGTAETVMKYTYIQYLVEPGRTLVFSFNCPKAVKDDWQPIAHEVMKSIRVKK